MSALPENKGRPSDLEANHNNDYRISGDTRTDNQTYQSTVLPASATDFDPEPHKRLFRQFANPAPRALWLCVDYFCLEFDQCTRQKCHSTKYRHWTWYGPIKTFVDSSACLWWICSVLCRNVGVCGW